MFNFRRSILALSLASVGLAACSSDNGGGTGGSGGGGGVSGAAGKGGAAGGAAGSGAAGSGVAGAAGGQGGAAGSGVAGAAGSSAGAGGGTAGVGGGAAGSGGGATGNGGAAGGGLNADIQNIVIIFAENRSFDGLFGTFPGANGLNNAVVTGAAGSGADGGAAGASGVAYIPQKDRDGVTVLAKLPQAWGGATASGNTTVVTQAMTDNVPNAPFPLETTYNAINAAPLLTTFDVTRDMAHRFFENQMELNGGTNDMFAAWEDAGGITMGHWDYSQSKLWKLAHDYVLADNFYMGAFGGSFLTHQYLICACAPAVSAAWVTSNSPSLNVLGTANSKGVPQLAVTTSTTTPSPASALDGSPILQTGNIAPLDYFGTGDGYRAVNTMQPAFQPSGNAPAASATDLRYADSTKSNTLPVQTQTTIGDLLTGKSIDWAWYATDWAAATFDGEQASTVARTVIYAPSGPRGSPDFQAHHHPYNYYANFDPATHGTARRSHLKDYNDLLEDIADGTVPPVAWYKPTGNVNQHPGYANLDDGDAHIADLVAKLQAGPQWQHMVIIVTYDEYGGQWDHAAVPKGDKLGPGERIPAIIISPYAKKGTVDHTQYDTGSTLRLITKRFGLSTLPGLTARDTALTAVSGGKAMGDLTNALTLP
jgi:acid phosphatase